MSEEVAARWEGFAAAELAGRWSVAGVHLFTTVGSTNDVGRRLVSLGASLPAVVLAEAQQVGRGRAGRTWDSPPGLGLWVSVVVPALPAAEIGALPVRAGLEVAEALDPVAGPGRVRIKWSNDLVVDGGKLGGILCESSWDAAGPGAVVIGLGLNVAQQREDFAAPLRAAATSLALEAGAVPPRIDVADAVVAALLRAAATRGPLPTERLRARDPLLGCRLRVTDPVTGRVVAEGVGEGVDAGGALLLRTDAGLQAIRSGTVRALPVTG